MESIQTVKAALERRECPMREAMETALQDRTAAPAELTVTWEEVCRYLDSLAARGRRRETIQVYRPKLEAFYHFLPEDKRVAADTLELWRAALLREGYSYLMVKVFALTGIRVSELNRVTVRAVEEGRVLTACDGRAQYVLIPACLRKELTVYLRRVGITAGPVFVTRSGRPMRRTQVSGEIRTLCRDARVDGDKSNPRCLRRLYQVTQERIRDSVQILAEQAHERMLEEEQLTVGWEQGS